MRACPLLLLGLLAGCRLLAPAVPCEGDQNCEQGLVCRDQVCVDDIDAGPAPMDRQDAGGPGVDDAGADDAGPPLDDDAGTNDAGPPLDDDAGTNDAGPDDAGPYADFPEPPPGCAAIGEASAALTGDVVVQGDADLAQLAGVQRLEGRLDVHPGAFAGDVSFPDLLHVTGSVFVVPGVVVDGAVAEVAPSFPCLQAVGGRVEVSGLAWPRPSFPALVRTGDDLQLNDGIASVDFPRLADIYDLELHDSLLTDLSGLSALRVLRDDLVLEGNTQLTTSAALLGISSVAGRIDVIRNDVLPGLDGVDHLVPGEGRLAIFRNPLLPTCEAELWRDRLVHEHFARGIMRIEGNDDTATCGAADPSGCPPTAVALADACAGTEQALVVSADDGIPAGTTCTGSLTISAGVESVCAPSLVQVTGDLVVDAGAALHTLRLPALRRVTGSVTVVIDGMTVLDLRRLAESGAVGVRGNAGSVSLDVYLPSLYRPASLAVRDIGGGLLYLPRLDRVLGALVLEDNPGPATLHLPDLDIVQADLVLQRNAAVTGLAGLGALDNVNGAFIVQEMAALTSLAGLTDLDGVAGSGVIQLNPQLVELPPATVVVAGAMTVVENACLDPAVANAWASAVSTVATVNNNGAAAPCPTP